MDEAFVPATLITAAVGWLSPVSFILTPIFLTINGYHWIKTRSLAPPS